MKQAKISTDVNIPLSATIAEDVTIGSGTLLNQALAVEPNVFIDCGVIFAGGGTTLTRIASCVKIGAGAVIGPNVEIGWGAHISPGSVVLTSIPANAIVSGNPAQIIGYTQGIAGDADHVRSTALAGDRRNIISNLLGVGGSAIYHMPRITDLRGALSVGELGKDFPFQPKRYFIVYDVPSEELRGEHAHRECEQFLICVRGSCRALLDDGIQRNEVILDRPDLGLYMPAKIWGTQYRYTRDAVLLVFASRPYEANDYVRTYEEFRTLVGQGKL
jgi:uncharacterized membrane protein